jgi:hypothetical protein
MRTTLTIEDDVANLDDISEVIAVAGGDTFKRF